MTRETLVYDKLDDGKVRCGICQRRCIIPPGGFGYCATRKNEDGKLLSLIFAEVSTWRVSPIEIKPLFHFHPGSKALSLGSLGCNFRCIGCQNWEIAHATLEGEADHQYTEQILPEKAVELAKSMGCAGMSWTYNEPTIWFEYTLRSAALAKKAGLYTNYVTNGFITEEALDLIGPHLDSFRVDLKGFSEDFYRRIAHVEDFLGILRVTERAKSKWGVHVEVITNVIPGYNDDDEQLRGIADWILSTLGGDTPWHLTRFIPHLELSSVPSTPIPALERGREIGVRAGLRFVYLGNVPGHPAENTYCPKCGELLIRRFNYSISFRQLEGLSCKSCGEHIPIVGAVAIG